MYVCMYICMYVCTHTHTRARAHTHTHTHTHVCVSAPCGMICKARCNTTWVIREGNRRQGACILLASRPGKRVRRACLRPELPTSGHGLLFRVRSVPPQCCQTAKPTRKSWSEVSVTSCLPVFVTAAVVRPNRATCTPVGPAPFPLVPTGLGSGAVPAAANDFNRFQLDREFPTTTLHRRSLPWTG